MNKKKQQPQIDRRILIEELEGCLRELIQFTGKRQGNQLTIRYLWEDIEATISDAIRAGYLPKEIPVPGKDSPQRPKDYPHIALHILKRRQ